MSYFWIGSSLNDFLIQGFNITSKSEFTGIFFGVLIVSLIFECLRTSRDFLLHRFLSSCMCKVAKSGNEIPLEVHENALCEKETENCEVEGSVDSKTNISGSATCCQNKINSRNGNSGGDADKSAERKKNSIDGKSSSSVDTIEICPEPAISSARVVTSGLKAERKAFLLFLSSVLHMCYICCGYCLMLAVMTFNVWILFSVVIGVGIGFFLCDTARRVDLQRNSDISWLKPRRSSTNVEQTVKNS